MSSERTDQAIANVLGALPAQGETETLSMTTSAATTTNPLTANKTYDMVSDVDCFVCASTDGGDDASTSDYFLPALTIVPISAQGTNLYVSAILASGTGTLYLSPRHGTMRTYG